VELAQAGPRQPRATAKAEREQAEKQRRHTEQTELQSAVENDLSVPESYFTVDGNARRIDRLSEAPQGGGVEAVQEGP
jgi:hypothetical protein